MPVACKMSRALKGGIFLSVGVCLYFFTIRSTWSPAVQYGSVIILSSQIHCFDKGLDYRIAQRGEYWVLYNYVPAARSFACHESVTYTTHADFTYLDNVQPLIERWKAPMSVALYAPGSDFATTLASVNYLRECGSPLIHEFVSFHVYFDSRHLPESVPQPQDASKIKINCTAPPPWYNVTTSYRSKNNLRYPINVGRNVARDATQTHYMLVSDIELYPSPGLVDDFLSMVSKQNCGGLRVFPLCPFEIETSVRMPSTKTELVSLLENGKAVPFHEKLCRECHRVPKMEEWKKAQPQPGLNVFHVARRRGIWEPFYIGTNADPYYDENLSWEGLRDKMTQGYALCALDYEFHILDNAFLVHRAGIKTSRKRDSRMNEASSVTNSIIRNYTRPALELLYGRREKCDL